MGIKVSEWPHNAARVQLIYPNLGPGGTGRATFRMHLSRPAKIVLPDADVVTLDRVVCCYPDADVLLVAAAARTRQVTGLHLSA